jgi:hypothetical protein
MEDTLKLCIQDTPNHTNHIVYTTQISYYRQRIEARSLIDTGASSSFVSSHFVRAH